MLVTSRLGSRKHTTEALLPLKCTEKPGVFEPLPLAPIAAIPNSLGTVLKLVWKMSFLLV